MDFPTTPNAQLCANCGQRPGTVRLVLAAEGGRRAVTFCEVCAGELIAAARARAREARRPPRAAAPAPPRWTSSAAT